MLSIILVETQGAGNIGAVARAMMNMDADRLILVNPKCDHFSEEAFTAAVHAQPILKSAVCVPEIQAALADADIKIAVSRRTGQWRKRDILADELAEYLQDYQSRNIALVFGREKTGLSNAEIQQCDLICSIPSSSQFPSLNLAQSVMVVLYELYRSKTKSSQPTTVIASRKEQNLALESILGVLESLDFFKTVSPDSLKSLLNRLLVRSKPDPKEANAIRSISERAQGVIHRLKKSVPKDTGSPE